MEKREFIVVVDSSSNLSKEYRDANNIPYVKMGLTKKFKDHDQEVIADIDWEVYSNKELNDWMRDGIIIKTSQVSNSEFTNVFSKLAREGKDILYIACSSALSGSYNFSLTIRDEILETYPDTKIVCVDSLNCDHAIALMAMDAIDMKNEGKTIEEVTQYLEENKLCYNQIGTVETLEFLKRAGRIKASKAFFGNIFGVKPIIISDIKGNNYAVRKVKGRKNSLIELVNDLKVVMEGHKDNIVFICHGDSIVDANFLKDLIEKEVNPKEVIIRPLGPIVGASTGPGTMVLYAKGNLETREGNV